MPVKDASKYKDYLINIVVLAIAAIIGFKIYIKSNQDIDALKKSIEEEKSKNKVLASLEEKEKEINAYRKYLNSKEITGILDVIGDIARESDIEIDSMRPSGENKYSFFKKYLFDIRCSAGSYHDIARFISYLESNKNVFTVESVSLSPEGSGVQRRVGRVFVEISLSTIVLVN
ncbi:MAG: type 4a pilus biogenesis protein PilO [Candidatus Omnitrophica bacterium]|jgi:Tfp pilus assembly protein PilO|nr:type 4a pilus biogenesis protein PilO [Candidatus Omnitrophota bacterium]